MIAVMSAWCLSFHASYRCRHAGACCRADWLIPAEDEVVRTVELHRIKPAQPGPNAFSESSSLRSVGRRPDGACTFLGDEGLCAIHGKAGPAALPVTCRHFPRVVLVDSRGTFVSLSHFCPTAAGLLMTREPPRIVEARPPLLLDPPVEGLDARDALPPLLRPGVLTDPDGYSAWERAVISVLGRDGFTCEEALDAIAAATEHVRGWRPGTSPLAASVEAAFSTIRDPPRPTVDDVEHVLRNYVAARLFGAWIAYQARGLRSIVEWLRTCASALRTEIGRQDDLLEAVRAADLLILHQSDSIDSARELAPLETAAAR